MAAAAPGRRRETTASGSPFLRIFAEQVARHGERTAVDDGERRYTYAQLDRLANRFAHAILARRGPGQEVVAVMLGNTAEAVAALLGVLKAGKIRLAIGRGDPAARLRQILEHAGASLLIAGRDSPVSRADSGTIDVLDPSELAVDAPVDDPGLEMDEQALAAIYYTSGSTGEPKGVVVGHGDAVAGAFSTACDIPVTSEDRVGVVSDLSFAISRTADMALLAGASLCLYDARAGGPRGVASWLRQARISFASIMASTLRALLEVQPDGAHLPDLRVLSAAGEPLFKADVLRFRSCLSNTASFVFKYGATETMGITTNLIRATDEVPEGLLPVGRPLAGVEIELADVGEGGVGEVIVRSGSVARGYWRDPQATAAAFGTDPVDASRRTFRTGDVGRFRPDGMLEIVGRADSRVKIRGYRVDPAEAEGALRQLEDVARAAVVGSGRGTADPRLVAYVVPAPGRRPTVNRLRRALLETLPPYMVPSSYVLLEALPLTRTGKVDRKALPPPPGTRPHLEQPYVEARNQLERTIVAIWEELLDTRPIGIDDDFYALGGDSLAAAQALAALEVELREPLPLLLFAEATATPAAIAALLRDRRDPIFSGIAPLQPRGSRPPFFCIGGGDGEVLELGPLGAALAPDQPFLALPGAHHRRRTVAAVAARHIEQIRAAQPSGPHRIGGYSAGGVTAFEMARQLAAAGTPPAVVVLLDAVAPPVARSLWKQQSLRLRLGLGTRLRGRLFDLGARAGLSLPAVWRGKDRFDRAARAMRAYRPVPYEGRVVLMRTPDHPGSVPRDLGWGPMARQLEIVEIPGRHLSLLYPPHVQKVGATLRDVLEGRSTSGRGGS